MRSTIDYSKHGNWWPPCKNCPDGVGQKKPNPWGLYDMYGNVREWVGNCYDDYPATGTRQTPSSMDSHEITFLWPSTPTRLNLKTYLCVYGCSVLLF
ncbi:MAG: formylglycine-generating enzyme family protein [Desulfovibrionaceae bacterium]|nr:formylglycine-generating enzyme family protein [Desulfovibrionaceae bacterium]